MFPDLTDYIGKQVFEGVCRQYLIRQNKLSNLSFVATRIGSWWGQDNVEKKQSDFDIVADNKSEKKVLLGECKWRNEFDDVKEIEKLINKTYLMPEYEEYYFIFFSKVPYTKAAKELEKSYTNLRLVTLDELFK